MAVLTFGGRSLRVASLTADSKPVNNDKGFFARALDALAQSQMQRAHRMILRHHRLLPEDHELRKAIVPRREDLPFGGR